MSIALRAPGRSPMTHEGLRQQCESTARSLRRLGVEGGDRVAAVLPNGAELAAAFVAISESAVFAPLNPVYSLTEFRFFLQDLQASALLTIPGFCPVAEEAARSCGVPLMEFGFDSLKAGVFRIEGEKVGRHPHAESGLGLLLHSSGTTARPKLVALTRGNLAASARAIAGTLHLGPEDTGLNLMPLFHIHGLVGSLLSSLAAGASVYCTPGFNALHFARWRQESRATWYTAVPSMHQALLARAEGDGTCGFRFVRSSSAHLHTRIWREMEARFACPVLNAYGMTEAAHQIASNPLPPLERKYGSVGVAAGPEFTILDCGEVGIRGANVASGYLAPVEANATAFEGEWFRTGDEGTIDASGYLTLTGRLKELINCGGEKVSPAEVDSVLMQHPAVAQALAFGIASESRGERVCAAVVLQSDVTEVELKRFARERLAAFKTPSRVLIVAELPKGPTGKMQRAGMAKRLGLE